MCGFVSLCKDEVVRKDDVDKIRKMKSAIEYRGPDQQGVFADKHICLGFNRLSIIDLEQGNQPLSYDNGKYQIVFNGEIYNYVELRKNLMMEGFTFDTQSDTEVILALYKKVGTQVVQYLRGMFAFVIWDTEKKTMFGARDHFGIKPFYYLELQGKLYCASEKKSIVSINDIPFELSNESLHHYLTFQYVPEPKTIFKHITTLAPGHMIQKKIGQKSVVEKYWSAEFTPVKSSTPNKMGRIKEALERSVDAHMRSDVPVGCFLSGGIDSTIITALARKRNPNLKAFTVGFEQDGYSEIDLARQTADALDIEHINKVITAEEFMGELPKIIWHMDGPLADPAAIPLYFVAREASKHVKVVLSGEGSDELFGGYNIYREPASLQLFSYIPKPLKKLLYLTSSLLPEQMKGKSFLYRGCTPVEDRYVGNANIFHQSEKSLYLRKYNQLYCPKQITGSLFDQVRDCDTVTKMQYIDINTWLRGDILLKADRMSMAHSIELRVPFLDKEVFEVASGLELNDKIRGKSTKFALRQAFKGIIPELVVERRKLGFPVPLRDWLKNELYEWAKNLIMNSQGDEYIIKENALSMLEKHRNGPVDYSRRIWTIIVFMLWHQVFIEKNYNFDYYSWSYGEKDKKIS